jgi:hypothetical protein
MDSETYIILIYKNLEGSINPSEKEQLDLWLEASPENEAIERNLRMERMLSGNYEPQIKVDWEEEE